MLASKKNQRKKVAIFFAGGTSLATDDGPKTVVKKTDVRDWLSFVPELAVLAETCGFFISAENETVKTPDHWIKLASEIEYRIDGFDGIVVIHDSASLIYTACAISFAIQRSSIPIVFTASPGIKEIKPDPKNFEEFGPVGLKANLLNAVQVATMNTADVIIVDRASLVRACLAQRVKLGEHKQIIAPQQAVLGSIEFGVVLSEFRTRRPDETELVFQPKFSDRVASVCLDFPDDIEKIEPAMKQAPAGLIIHGRGVNPFSKDVLNQLNPKIPTLILTNSEQTPPADLKAIVVSDMTREAAVVKFIWALGKTNNLTKLREIMNKDLIGEHISSV